jgi:hypothetical protein
LSVHVQAHVYSMTQLCCHRMGVFLHPPHKGRVRPSENLEICPAQPSLRQGRLHVPPPDIVLARQPAHLGRKDLCSGFTPIWLPHSSRSMRSPVRAALRTELCVFGVSVLFTYTRCVTSAGASARRPHVKTEDLAGTHARIASLAIKTFPPAECRQYRRNFGDS